MALKPIKVSQVNQYIKRILQTDPILANLSVTGEISNLKYHDTGNVYFTMKDEGGKLSCFLPASALSSLRYELADGMEITAFGRINVYEKGGSYSLYVSGVEVSGIGDLNVAFFQLKDKLEKEGLFDPKYKKEIPAFAKKIVVITAETGAAVRDILRTIRNKNDVTDVIVYPCLVQGVGAAADISRAIEQVNLLFPTADCIILGRGGGSVEELWAFNEEAVARSIFASVIPVISAVGHETDFTIADFVADCRSATPTAAAELAAFDSHRLRKDLSARRLDIKYAMQAKLRRWELEITGKNMEMLKATLLEKIERYTIKADHLISDMAQSARHRIEKAGQTTESCKDVLDSLNPTRLLGRGYAAVTNEKGEFLRSVHQTAADEKISVLLLDGELDCLVQDVTPQKQT